MKNEQVATRPADCPQRHTHRGLVGTGARCAACANVIPAGPFDGAGWAALGITTLIDKPSPSTPKGELDALAEHDREWALREADLRQAQRIVGVEIPELHTLTGWTAEGEAVQGKYNNSRERDLYDKVQELTNSAEKHAQKARAALLRRSELMAKRDDVYRRELAISR